MLEAKKRKKSESKPHSQVNKCLNEKRRREQENIHIEELAELVSASPSDMSSLSCKPDKCAILKETVNQIRSQKQSTESELCDDLQQSEVSSSKPNIINNHIFGSILLEALEGFLFVVTIEGKVEFVSENITGFLKYHQDEVYEKNIYDFIHPDDRARFNSNLLLMMPLGNGRDWSPENNFDSSGKPTKHFNCRFLVRQEEPEIKMENKQPQIPQYENLSITANYIPLGDEGNNDVRNGLTCIARRVAVEEKRVGVNKVEQFTTRVDRDGKVVDLDTSILSPVNGQYLRKELLGSQVLDFCHPSDLPTLKQHLKETLETGAAICIPFKFRVGRDRYAKVKTKSKRFHCMQSVGEIIISTHAIIRDSDNSATASDSQKSIDSPSSHASSSSGPGSVSDSSTSINGSSALSPLTLSNSYGSYPTSISAPSSSEFGLGDLVLDMFPSSSWALDHNSTQSKESDCASGASFVSSPQAAPSSNRSSETSAAASPTNSAFVLGLSSSRSGSSAPSPAMQSRAPTPYGGSCYSPSASQSSSGKSSPPRALPAKADSFNCSSTETSGINSLSQGIRQEKQFDVKSNQKLRNLLTQSADDSNVRQNSRQVSQEEVTVLSESRVFEERLTHVNARDNPTTPRSSGNVILRDLLNQDDDDSDAPVEPIEREVSVPNPLINVVACKATENSAQQRLGNNNMLRKLLNNDDVDKNYRKSQDLIHQLLIAGSTNKAASFQNDKVKTEIVTSPRIADSSVPKQIVTESNRGTPDVTFLSETNVLKRKSVEKNPPTTLAKRPNVGAPHAHLAGQNPMLASMLAQTPRTPPLVPTSVASTIMTQLPQERLPKNLEKKLVHTPYTATVVSGTSTSTQAFPNSLTSSSGQRDVVTSDSRGHVLQTSNINVQSGLKTVYSQQQGIIDKLLSGNEDNVLIARSLGLSFSTVSNTPVQNSSTFVQQLSQTASENSAAANLAGLLSEAALIGMDSADSAPASQASDPVFAEILEEIYSLQEEHNLETPPSADDHATILKLLDDTIESPPSNITSLPVPATATQDINEKIAISAIQKELMEGSSAAIASRATTLQNTSVIPTYSLAGRSNTQVSGTGTPVVQTQLTAEQILLLQQQQQLVAGSVPVNYNIISNRIRLPLSAQAQLTNNPDLLTQAQRRGLHLVRNVCVERNVNQIRKTMKQRLYLQQQQKRLLEQQQKQQLTMQTQQPLDVISSPGTSPFPENMNDLLNNTVAPNVTLLHSSGIPEVPGSARFNITLSNPLPSPTNQTSPTPAQLSPGQRCNPRSPFSPLSQQPFPSQTPPPSSYQSARVSPHPPPSYPQGGPSHSPSPVPPTGSPHMVVSPQPSTGSPQWNQRIATSPIQNLQLQNPMLNAQLSQQAPVGTTQVRIAGQQRQQLTLRSMPSPTSGQNTRNTSFSSQSEVNYSPVSPVMVLQSQAPQQQRIQRTISGPARITAGSQSQSNFVSSEPVPSPQPLSSPNFTQTSPSTAVSTFVSIPSPGVSVTYSAAQGSQHFNFERPNVQVFTTNTPSESMRSSSIQGTSDLVRQELRSVVNSRNQPLSQSSSSNQQVLQSLSSGSVTRVLNVHSLTRETLEELGLSVELLSGADAQPSSQALYSQALLSVANNLENTSQPIVTSPRVLVEEPKPADQKKSLLQQLLSEPT